MDKYSFKLAEQIELYLLKPHLRTLYVEGVADRLFFQQFLEKQEISDVEIYQIDFVNLEGLYETNPSLASSNRLQVITLANIFLKEFNNTLQGITCIIDQDFDAFENINIENHFLKYTDFANIEMYIEENTMSHFFEKFLHGFPRSPKDVFAEIEPIANFLFRLRYIKEKTNISYKDSIWNENIFDKCHLIDKKTKKTTFNSDDYIIRIAGNKKDIITFFKGKLEIHTHRNDLNTRHQIHGHDFIYLIFKHIDKIKNPTSLNLATFERLIYQYIEYHKLGDYPLFSFLYKKYS